MTRTRVATADDMDQAMWELSHDRKRSPVVALGVTALMLVAGLLTVYLSYRDVPAPQNPANARPHLVEPYR